MSQITDDDGRFVFEDVLAGEYNVTATRAAFLPAAYGARRPGRLASRLSVAAGASITDVTLYMSRGAAIEGTVRDFTGEPAANMGVIVAPAGEVQTMSSGLGSPWMTDDRGVYRAYGLAPGAYVVLATPQAGTSRRDRAAVRRRDGRSVARAHRPVIVRRARVPPFDGP